MLCCAMLCYATSAIIIVSTADMDRESLHILPLTCTASIEHQDGGGVETAVQMEGVRAAAAPTSFNPRP